MNPVPEKKKSLSTPQIRVMQALGRSRGPLSRGKLTEVCGNKTQVVVGRAVGYSDPARRVKFENSADGGFRPSLLTLEYVIEYDLDIDGLKETVIELTEKGRAALNALGDVELPMLRDSYNGRKRGQRAGSGGDGTSVPQSDPD